MLSVPLISLQPKCKTEWRCRSSMPTIMVTSTCRLTVGWSGQGAGRGGLWPYKDHFALRPQKQGGLLGGGGGWKSEGSTADTAPPPSSKISWSFDLTWNLAIQDNRQCLYTLFCLSWLMVGLCGDCFVEEEVHKHSAQDHWLTQNSVLLCFVYHFEASLCLFVFSQEALHTCHS